MVQDYPVQIHPGVNQGCQIYGLQAGSGPGGHVLWPMGLLEGLEIWGEGPPLISKVWSPWGTHAHEWEWATAALHPIDPGAAYPPAITESGYSCWGALRVQVDVRMAEELVNVENGVGTREMGVKWP